jgi:carboxyl-terminal processing protease
MNRPFRIVATFAVAAALALGVAVRFVRADQAPAPAPAPASALLAARSPAALAASTPRPAEALAYATTGSSKGKGATAGEDYRLDRLPILGFVFSKIHQAYVDPTRIDPKAMVVAALDSVERTVAEVMVKGDATSDKLTVTVGNATRDFAIKDVDTIWNARLLLGEVMGFVQENLVAHDDLREIEYAAAAGVLSTLDPHSVVLEPKFFRDMKTQTRGEFGGIGFAIAMRDGNLTVVRVFKNTPAQKAGIRSKDVITRIGEQSTINMDVQDAVDRLRGKPQTPVAITVSRSAWPEPRRMQLLRDTINVETIPQAKLLDQGVGYLRYSTFARNGTREISKAIQQQKAKAGGNLKGLILDLRGNPGGLLDEAVELSDLFLSEGVIVKTVSDGAQRQREVREATSDPKDLTSLPLVVLVNGSSASASEIVAGALKNNGRALIVGRPTFGKGSVQTLFDFTEPGRPTEEAALKLTIAQYLTPGDVSIQEVGILPDVALLPGRALRDQINVFAPPRAMGEADLDRHLSNPGGAKAADLKKRRTEKSPLELRYLLDEKEDAVARALKREAARDAHGDETALSAEQQEDEEIDADPDQVKEDYQIRFARELLARAPFADRTRLLEAAGALVGERRAEEEKRLEGRLTQLGIDWSPPQGTTTGTPRALVTVTPPAGRPQKAGEVVSWTVTVENRGDAPFRRLRAWTLDEKNFFLDRREFVFGTIRPGERKSWSVPLKLPRSFDSRRDEVILHFDDDQGKAPADVLTSLDVVEVPRPLFAYSLQVDDRKGGNGDGLPARGETFTVRLDVRNVGAGTSGDKTYVTLKNLGDEKLFIKKGREVLGALRPGESRHASMEIELKAGTAATLPIRVQVVDEKSGEYLSQKLELAVAPGAEKVLEESGGVRVDGVEAVIRGGASATAPVVATIRKGAVLPLTGSVAGFRRVEWSRGRFGFLASADVTVSRAARTGGAVEAWQHEPPRITLVPDPARGAPVVETDTFRLSGSAILPPSADPDARLRDVYIFVNDEKVFFRVVPDAAAGSTTATAATNGRLDFTTDLPLKPGQNVVTVFAREDQELQSRRSVVIFRKGGANVAEGNGAHKAATGKP